MAAPVNQVRPTIADHAIDFVLEPGGLTEEVKVIAESTPVKTVGGDVSGTITGQQVRELPLNGRNFLQLATLMPGVSAPDFLNVKDKGLLGGSDLSVSGSGVTSNMWTVDGANNNYVGSNRTILVYPSVDAIEEFKILRNSYGAEFGQASGAQINIVTPGDMYGDRLNQLDFRVGKVLRYRTIRSSLNVDLYNVFNNNWPFTVSSTFSTLATSQWLRPTNVLQARFFKLGLNFDF